MKHSFQDEETVTEMGRLIFSVFQRKMELDFITVSELLIVPVAKGLLKH